MADILETGSNWLEDQRVKFMTRTVSYKRGDDSVDVQATVGRTVFETQNDYGVMEKTETRDFLILSDDLLIGGQPVLPKRGDQVKETVGTKVLIYEVMAPGKEPEWRHSDPYRKTLRVHTRLVNVEDA